MNIELKNIKYYESFSEETLAFNANLYIEGKRAGIAKNDGRGGATYYMEDNKEGQELIIAIFKDEGIEVPFNLEIEGNIFQVTEHELKGKRVFHLNFNGWKKPLIITVALTQIREQATKDAIHAGRNFK